MNITILCNRDLASNLALNHLLPALAGEHSLRVFYSSQVGGSQPLTESLAMLKFFEQTLFNELLFPALAGATSGRGLLGFEGLANKFGIAVAVLNSVNSQASLGRLAAGAPDLLVSIRYGGILREAAIAVPRLGVINLHSGLLPDYRGVMATFRAMARGDEFIGTTLHTIDDAGIDTGRIIATDRQAVDYGRSYLWNVLQLYPAGVELILSALATLNRGHSLPNTVQGPGGSYYSFPTAAELDDFHRRGLKLYDVPETLEIAQRYLSDQS